MTFSLALDAQVQKTKWNNKKAGTYSIDPHVMSTATDSTGISIKIYDVSSGSCKPIEGWVKINNKKFFVYDSTNSITPEGFKDIGNLFQKVLPAGTYKITLSKNRYFYSISTSDILLEKSAYYIFTFYVVRKNAITH
jgi:hypothetical protein